MNYSSKDFGRTKAKLEVDLPERLVHRDVEGNARDETEAADRLEQLLGLQRHGAGVDVELRGVRLCALFRDMES